MAELPQDKPDPEHGQGFRVEANGPGQELFTSINHIQDCLIWPQNGNNMAPQTIFLPAGYLEGSKNRAAKAETNCPKVNLKVPLLSEAEPRAILWTPMFQSFIPIRWWGLYPIK